MTLREQALAFLLFVLWLSAGGKKGEGSAGHPYGKVKRRKDHQ